MKQNTTISFLQIIAACMLCAVTQSSYAADAGEKGEGEKGENEQSTKINLNKIYFVKQRQEGPDVPYASVACIAVDPAKNHFKIEGSEEVYLALTPGDFTESFPYAKFLGQERDQKIIESATNDAKREFESKMSRAQKYPKTVAALLVGATAVGTTAISMLFN